MSAIVNATFTVKEGLMDEFKEFMRSENGLQVTRGFKGCREILTSINTDNNLIMHIHERWVSKADWEAYFAFRGENGFADLAAKFFDAPPVFVHSVDSGI